MPFNFNVDPAREDPDEPPGFAADEALEALCFTLKGDAQVTLRSMLRHLQHLSPDARAAIERAAWELVTAFADPWTTGNKVEQAKWARTGIRGCAECGAPQ